MVVTSRRYLFLPLHSLLLEYDLIIYLSLILVQDT